MKLTPQQIQNYVRAGGIACPFCNSAEIEGAFVETNEGTAHQEMFCLDCEQSWTDVYTLTTIHRTED